MADESFVDIWTKVEQGYYDNKMPMFEKIPVDPDKMTINQAKKHDENEVARRRAWREECSNEDARLLALFKSDLEQYFGITGHPKAGKCFDLAYFYGHSSGYSDIFTYYADLVDLIN